MDNAPDHHGPNHLGHTAAHLKDSLLRALPPWANDLGEECIQCDVDVGERKANAEDVASIEIPWRQRTNIITPGIPGHIAANLLGVIG